MSHEHLPQKTIPRVGHKTRDAGNGPDAPSVSMKPLLHFAIEFPGQKPPINGNGAFETQTVLKDVGYGRKAKVVKISPRVRQPLTPLFENHKGGHTVGGGGTSPEALRRAKQKAKKSLRK